MMARNDECEWRRRKRKGMRLESSALFFITSLFDTFSLPLLPFNFVGVGGMVVQTMVALRANEQTNQAYGLT